MRILIVASIILATFPLLAIALDIGDDEQLVNGGFDDWADGLPTGWSLITGATEGDGPESTVQPGKDMRSGRHCLSLAGDAQTQRWIAVNQSIAVEPGQIFRFAGWLRAQDVQRGNHHYGNSQAAIVAKSAGGQSINMWLLGPATGTTDWTLHEHYLQAPPGSTSFDVVVFLSMNGVLECDGLSLIHVPAPSLDSGASRDERWRTDVAYLADLLPRLHVDPFTVTSEAAFLAQADDLAAAVADLDDLQINLRLMALVASLGDAHSGIGFATRPRRLPIQFEFFCDDLRVLSVTSDCAVLAGGVVTRIGDQDIQDVLAAVRPVIACETESWFRRQAPQMLRLVDVVEGLGFTTEARSVTVTVLAEDGSEQRCRVALAGADLHPEFEVREPAADALPLYLSNQANYWSHYLEDARTFYVQFNRCREDPQRPMAGFTADVAAALDSLTVDRFVLDLRHNSGGGSTLLNGLIAAVAERKNAGAIDRCFVITGRATFSAAALNTLDFRRATGALVVGEPMGNKPNRFGQLSAFTLPSSGLQVHYATKHFVRLEGDPPELVPDLPVTLTWQDYLAGRDPALEVILR